MALSTGRDEEAVSEMNGCKNLLSSCTSCAPMLIAEYTLQRLCHITIDEWVHTRIPAVSPRRRHRLCVTVIRARRMDGGGANMEAAAGCAGCAECKWKLRYDEAMVRID